MEVAGRDRIERLSPTALRAYDLVLRARALTLKVTRANNQQALACAERAMQLDPTSAAAHAHAAWCHFYNYMAFWSDPELSLTKAYEVMQRAVVLDETDSFAHTIMGSVQWFRRDFDQARTEYLEGIERNPNDFLARRYYGMFLAATGNPEAGIEQINLGSASIPSTPNGCRGTGASRTSPHGATTKRSPHSSKSATRSTRFAHGWPPAMLRRAAWRGQGSTRRVHARSTIRHGRLPRQDAQGLGILLARMFEYQDEEDFDHLYKALRKAGMPD